MHIRVLTDKPHVARRYEKATRFFLDCLLTKKEQEPLDVTIGFYPEDVFSKSQIVVYGDTVAWHGEEHENVFHVRINKSRPHKMSTLAHELVHVKQAIRGEWRPSKTNKTIYWKGEKHRINSKTWINKKDELPWEVEAVKMEKELYKEWKAYERLQS